jgi:hypothetical protein
MPGVKSLHVAGRHQGNGADVECVAAGAHDFEARLVRVGGGSDFQRELLVRTSLDGNRDGLRVARAGSPNQPG